MALLTITFRRLDLLAAALAWWLVCIFFLWRVCCNFNLYYWAGAAIILCDLLSVMLFKHYRLGRDCNRGHPVGHGGLCAPSLGPALSGDCDGLANCLLPDFHVVGETSPLHSRPGG